MDPEWVEKPRHWDTLFIRNYMVVFGLLSSVFDFLTFGVLLWVFHAAPDEFRTGWFLESLMTELVIALVVRTRRPFSTVLGFVPLPWPLLLGVIGLTLSYVVAVELAKKRFYRHGALRARAH